MNIISIEEALDCNNIIYIDVRSPLEYKESTVPGAINIPIFSNEEREEIGYLFHRNKELAYEKGFKIGSSKLFDIYKKIKSIQNINKKEVVVFCWRGGMRSKSIVINLRLMGIN